MALSVVVYLAISLLIPPVLLATAAILGVIAYRRGTLRRSLAYLVLSRSRRSRFMLIALAGFAFFVPAGILAFLGMSGQMPLVIASEWSAVTRLIGAAALFSAAVVATRDVPVNAMERPEVEAFRAEVLSFGLAEGLDAPLDLGE